MLCSAMSSQISWMNASREGECIILGVPPVVTISEDGCSDNDVHVAYRYHDQGLKDLCDEMFEFKKTSRQGELLFKAYEKLPTPEMRPRVAFERLMRGEGICI